MTPVGSRWVAVDWQDAVSDSGQHTAEQARARRPLAVTSVGFLVAVDEEAVVLAQTRTEHGDYTDLVTIPRASIVRTHPPDLESVAPEEPR